jgi:hypothetical protein
MYHGGFERNFGALQTGATTFVGTDGTEHPLGAWPATVDGIRIGYMEQPGKRFAAVRVMDGTTDIVLHHEMLLDGARHMGYGKRFSAEPTVIDDDGLARVVIEDIIRRNPDQRAELLPIRERLPKARKRALK